MGHEQLHNQGNSTLFINKQEQNKDRMTFPSLGKIPLGDAVGDLRHGNCREKKIL